MSSKKEKLKRNIFLVLTVVFVILVLCGGNVDAATFKMTTSTTKKSLMEHLLF